MRFGRTSRNPLAFWACVLARVLDSSHFAFWIQQIYEQLQRPRVGQTENSNTRSSLWYDIVQARIHLHNGRSLVVVQGSDWQSNLITGRWERERETETEYETVLEKPACQCNVFIKEFMCRSIVRKQLCPVGLWALAPTASSTCVLVAF